MSQTNFEKLEIYQLAEKLSGLIWTIAMEWKNLARQTVAPQLVRSADSIGANIAEGSGRGSDKDYLRFLRISRGSLYETKHWLRLAYSRKLLSQAQIEDLKPIIEELTPKLNSYIKAVGKVKSKVWMDKDQSPNTEAQ